MTTFALKLKHKLQQNMKKLGKQGIKALKIMHILTSVMWIGGVMALVSIQLFTHPTTPQMMQMAAQDQLVIDKLFLIPGGVGIVVTALIYSILTGFGIRPMWIKVKWILTVLLVIIGKAYMGVLIEENVAYAELIVQNGASTDSFFQNVNHVAIAGMIQLVGFLAVIILSVVKPWLSSKIGLSKKTFFLLLIGLATHAVGKLLHLQGDTLLFYPGVCFFIIGHVCYLYLLTSSLGKSNVWQRIILASPLLIFWIPAVVMTVDLPMKLVVASVMLCILSYISCGITGLAKLQSRYVYAIIGGILFLISDTIAGVSSATSLYVVSQASFYLGEVAIVLAAIMSCSSPNPTKRYRSDAKI